MKSSGEEKLFQERPYANTRQSQYTKVEGNQKGTKIKKKGWYFIRNGPFNAGRKTTYFLNKGKYNHVTFKFLLNICFQGTGILGL